MNLKAAYVVWTDPASIDPWTSIDEVDMKANVIHSLGLLVKENNEVIALALNLDKGEETVSCTMLIPKANIIEKKITSFGLINEKEN